MIQSTQKVKRILLLSTCALALGSISSVSSAHTCMKKPHGQGYTKPMHPPSMHGYYRPMKPYGYRAPAYRKPAMKHGPVGGRYDKVPHREAQSSASEGAPPKSKADIFETATAAGNFDTLIKAIVTADLYDTLRGEGPFTVFAPTDTAFAKLPAGTIDTLLADKKKLTATLGYHVVPGRLSAAELLTQRQFKTLQGQMLSVDKLNVVSADIETANGIVHVIDDVLMPNP